jgi:hypothetical protein
MRNIKELINKIDEGENVEWNDNDLSEAKFIENSLGKEELEDLYDLYSAYQITHCTLLPRVLLDLDGSDFYAVAGNYLYNDRFYVFHKEGWNRGE